MKMKSMISCIGALALGFSGLAFASGSYSPPERLHCKTDTAGKLSCSEFNRQYLIESTYTADLPAGKNVVFNFASGAAYYTDQDEWTVFYTYKNAKSENVRLKSINTSIKPDLDNGAWQKGKDFYTCSAGYMSCGVTSLPSKS